MHKKSRKILSIVLTLAMILCMMPGMALPVYADVVWTEYNDYYSLRNAIQALDSSTLNARLTADIVCDRQFVLPYNKNATVNLDLNGHVITRNDSQQGMSIFQVSGTCTLNIIDSNPTAPHTLYKLECGTYSTDSGSGGTEVQVSGGVITGGWSDDYGGAICNLGTVTMSGGTICGNKANYKGGGIANNSSSNDTIFTMTGGKICDNSIASNDYDKGGGGVYNSPRGTFIITGGEVCDNYVPNGAKGGGVYQDSVRENSFRLSGSVNISDNTAGTAQSDIYLGYSGGAKMYITGALSQPSEPIGVRIQNSDDLTDAFTVGYGSYVSGDLDDYFISEDSKYYFVVDNGELKLAVNHTHSFTDYTLSSDHKSISATCTADDCPLTNDTATLTIAAPLHTHYNDGKSTAAVISDPAGMKGSAAVLYYTKSGGSYGEPSETAPSDVGLYKASITVGGKTAYVEYEIQKEAETAPSALQALEALTIDYQDESSITADSGYEVAASNTGATITSFSDILDQTTPTVYVRKLATDDNHAPSDWVAVTLESRPEAPSESDFTVTKAEHGTSADGKILGVTTAMEYSLNGGTSWTDGTGEAITGLNPGNYLVRVASTINTPHGRAATVTVGSKFVALTASSELTVTNNHSNPIPRVGDVLSAGTSATNLAYQWYAYETMPGGGRFEPIDGATSSSYTLTADALGKKVRLTVYQTINSNGTSYASSARPHKDSETLGPVAARLNKLQGIESNPLVITNGDAVCLDLNGHIYSGTITVESGGKLDIIDSTGGGTVTNTVENYGQLTIEAGTFESDVINKGQAIIFGGVFKTTVGNVRENLSDTCAVSIVDGYFNHRPVATNEAIYLLGGKFKEDPTTNDTGMAPNPNVDWDGYQVVIVSNDSYLYRLAERPNTAADVKIDQGTTEGTASSSITGSDAAAAAGVAQSTHANLESVAVDQVKKIVSASQNVTDSSKNIVIVPSLTVETQTYEISGGNTTLTLNIEARYVSYETDNSINDAADVQASLNNQDGRATQIGSGKLDTRGTSVVVKFQVPDAFASALGATSGNDYSNAKDVYVRHTHDNKNYQYPAKLYYEGVDYFVEFTNPNGFSPFTLSQTSESKVHINVSGSDRYYTDFQSAVDDAADGAVIVLETNDNVSGSLNTAKTIIVDKDGHTGNVVIAAGTGYRLETNVIDADKTSYEAVKQSSGGHSGGSSGSGTKTDEDENKATEPEPTTVTGTVAGFKDVKKGQWYSDGIEYVVSKGYMSGYDSVTFAPFDKTSRGMIAQVFFNMEKGNIAGALKELYSDVKLDKWFAKAIGWATDYGVMDGYGNSLFGPNDPVTREQLVTIIYRYAKLKGYDVSKQADLSGYKDAGKVGSWALEAMQWAVGSGLISGKTDTTLNPADHATRAEIATIIMRFCETTFK